MITVNLMGGTGNQCFQLAYGRALEARGRDVFFTSMQLINATDHRVYSLDGFNTVVRLSNPPAGAPFYEKGVPFDSGLLDPPEPGIVHGYFQSEQYFLDIEATVRKELTLKNELGDVANNFAREILNSESVSVHVRRGDYLRLQAFHGIMPPEYYQKALQIISGKIYRPKIFLFSDDHQWCRENMSGTIVDTGNKYEDLHLMSLCKHAVIVNSSFSWWGAWLNPDKERIVIAPEHWFTTKQLDSRDVVPSRWMRI